MPSSPGGREIERVDGSPEGVSSRGDEMKDLAEMMADSASTLETIRDGTLTDQAGQAAEELQSEVGLYPLELQLVAQAYRQVGQVLVTYGDLLDEVKPRLNREAEDCDELWRTYEALPGNRYGNTDPDVAGVGPGAKHMPVDEESKQAAEDNQAKKDAYEAWEQAAEDFDRHYDTWEQGYEEAVDGITAEVSGEIENGWWSSIFDLISAPAGVSDEVRPYLMGKDLPSSATGMARLWEKLSAADKAALAERYPNLGNRGGIPAAERDLLNRDHLRDVVADVEQRKADLEEQLAELPVLPGNQTDRSSLEAEIEELDDQLDNTYADLEETLSKDDRYLLHFDDEGRAAIAVNNPDTADNVATFVPGVNSELSNIDGGVGAASRLVHQSEVVDRTATSAAIAWYGYHAPSDVEVAGDGTVSVASGGAPDLVTREMQVGAPRLGTFQDGLVASREGGPANVTVIGHSYGSSVVGLAATDELRADQVVLLGSPGVPVADVTDLHLIDGHGNQTPAGRVGNQVYAGKAENDPIPYAADTWVLDGVASGPSYVWEQGHNLLNRDEGGPLGNDPTDPDFGAQSIASDPGPEMLWVLPTVDAHTQYLNDGSTTLEELGPVLAGKDK